MWCLKWWSFGKRSSCKMSSATTIILNTKRATSSGLVGNAGVVCAQTKSNCSWQFSTTSIIFYISINIFIYINVKNDEQQCRQSEWLVMINVFFVLLLNWPKEWSVWYWFTKHLWCDCRHYFVHGINNVTDGLHTLLMLSTDIKYEYC